VSIQKTSFVKFYYKADIKSRKIIQKKFILMLDNKPKMVYNDIHKEHNNKQTEGTENDSKKYHLGNLA